MEAKKQRKRFPAEIRSDVVKMVVDGGKKRADVGTEFGVPTANVYARVGQARIDAGNSGSHNSTTADRSKLARLHRELKLREQKISFLKNVDLLHEPKETRFRAIVRKENAYPIAMMNRLLGVSKAVFYWWKKAARGKKIDRKAPLVSHIKAILNSTRGVMVRRAYTKNWHARGSA